MTVDVVCLRPEVDFTRVGVHPPADLAIAYRAPGDDDVAELIAEARALVIPAVGPPLPSALFDATRLALVQVTGAGVDRLDRTVMQRRGIAVCNVPGGSNTAVAEYVVTAASVLLRRVLAADAGIKEGRYAAVRGDLLAQNLAGLHGLQVGIVGMGTIGLAVARAFAAFGCAIAYHDPAPPDRAAAHALGARELDLETLLATADVVTLHVPLLPATRGLIDAAALARMKPGAVLINAARGGVVDERALARALCDGRIGGAAVDVYSTEPPDALNPLLTLPGDAGRRVLLTPHLAGVTLQASQYLFRAAWENVERVLLAGEAPGNRVY